MRRILVIDIMSQAAHEHYKPGDSIPFWAKCNACARVAILEKKVSLNGRRVTHTETRIPLQTGTNKLVLSVFDEGRTHVHDVTVEVA